jgi:hypothetical protein
MPVFELTEEQKQKILDLWNSRPENPPTVMELTEVNFPGKDGRSLEGLATRKFLASRSLEPKTTASYIKKSDQILFSEAEKEFIRRNAKMSPVEIARVLFKDSTLNNLSAQHGAVVKYLETLVQKEDPNASPDEDVSIVNGKYYPPKNTAQTAARINKYIYKALPEFSKLSSKQKRDLEVIKGFLYSWRLQYIINAYRTKEGKELFEASLLSYIYNKPDLTAEELDACINLAMNVVALSEIEDIKSGLMKELKQSDSEDNKGIKMSLVEAVKGMQADFNSNQERQRKLVQDIQGRRSDRLDAKLKATSSIINLIESWKNQAEREKLIKLQGLATDEEVRLEIERLETMEGMKARIFGINPEEVQGLPDE